MTKVHVAEATIMPLKRAARKISQKKEFAWSDDEAQLLLEVAHDYKVRHLAEGHAGSQSSASMQTSLN